VTHGQASHTEATSSAGRLLTESTPNIKDVAVIVLHFTTLAYPIVNTCLVHKARQTIWEGTMTEDDGSTPPDGFGNVVRPQPRRGSNGCNAAARAPATLSEP